MPDPSSPDAGEASRLAALRDLAVLDTLPEPVFDAITKAAAEACGVPIALVSLVDAERQWFKSNIGLPGVEQTPRDVAFCDHAIRGTGLFEVPDARDDARFAANPLVTGAPDIRFYAGAPIGLPGGERLGTVCVIDRQPRRLSDAQRAMLQGLARVASAALIDRRRQVETHSALALSESRYRAIVEDQSELVALAGVDARLSFVNGGFARHFGVEPETLLGRLLPDLAIEADRAAWHQRLQALMGRGESIELVNRVAAAHGEQRWVSWTQRPIVASDGTTVAVHTVGRDVTEQHRAEVRLREALQEKETLLKEVYHRVKNNLQMVQSLLSLQHQSTPDAGARAALAESSRRIRAMAMVHEKLYQTSNLARLSLQAYTQDLLKQIGEAADVAGRSIRMVAAIDDQSCGLDGAVPFGLLVTELVFNALEHGFGDRASGLIRVELVQRDGQPWLTVSDDGIGLRPGFELGGSQTMGLQLAVLLAAQLGGHLVAHNQAGAVFSTALPRL